MYACVYVCVDLAKFGGWIAHLCTSASERIEETDEQEAPELSDYI